MNIHVTGALLAVVVVCLMRGPAGASCEPVWAPCASCAGVARAPHDAVVGPAEGADPAARPKRATSRQSELRDNPLSALRKQMNARNKNDELMADARLEPNYTSHQKSASQPLSEQDYNRNNNKLRQLYNLHNPMRELGYVMPAGVECNFEELCRWHWKDERDGFVVVNAERVATTDEVPKHDANNDTSGHFLLLRISSTTKELDVTSPLFRDSVESCRLQVALYQRGMYRGAFKVVVDTVNHTQWLVSEIHGEDSSVWKTHSFKIGRISQSFNIILEVVPGSSPAFIALDNIKLIDCFDESFTDVCTPHQFKCTATNICINTTKICDITLDCLYGEDEIQNCDKMPIGARCNFEEDWCGWHNVNNNSMQWRRHNGSTPTNKTGPNFDHTFMNSTGKYLYVNMADSEPKGAGFASSATINSVVFNPPPRVHGNASSRFYNSCTIRFYYHQYGYHKSAISLLAIEIKPKENISTEIWWSHADYGDTWMRRVVILPNITNRYFLQFDARKGISSLCDVAIDDLSLSPECFGLNIPGDELRGYNYWFPAPFTENIYVKDPHDDFVNATYYEFTSCGVRGRDGPTQDNCSRSYNNSATRVTVLNEPGLVGVQRWTAPTDGFFTLILFGASGGKGSSGMGSSRGAMVRTVMELRKGQELFVLVGQQGTSSCIKSLSHYYNTSCASSEYSKHKEQGIRGVLNLVLKDGGGGGGGGTFVFLRNRTRQPVPLAVAAGGGGLGLGRFIDTGLQHGQAINLSRLPVTGNMYGKDSAGAGGGWDMYRGLLTQGHELLMGASLLNGGRGGLACYQSTDGRGHGGFGGGGGGCIGGGGGGGYAGGNALNSNVTNGEGGYSYLDPSQTVPRFSTARSGQHAGGGMVVIIPAVPGCGCDYRCLALDVRRSQVACICPKGWVLERGKLCILLEEPDTVSKTFVLVLFVIVVVLIIGIGTFCISMYNKYQQRTSGVLRRKIMSGPDLQLNRLRVASDSMMTEYNPNYEIDGVVCALKDIPRDQLRLVKALGQGAFGEVYQGFYRQRSGDVVEMPVAVKTLPEMSTKQAEMDFLMEALIMSKFNHPNIVHFIGVCFDKHPRFIVLELLAGGDLKNFLRESRPKPERGSSLTTKDLVYIAIDVAKGCKYMEDNRFIHRDIAARNCLLTTKGPGRVVKIADFGMSRDIYRSDYYRKGGKAMLPIKWMPPEAFLDGIFTSKTDVWSFGVLLWEIMSMGYMPYTGCANRDVVQLVTSGGRLEPPANCPGPLYAIMTQCWHPAPEQRPNFGLILERLGYCAQDPQVMSAPLPVFNRPPSNERDTTVMRPENSDESYLKVPHAADYLVPTAAGTPAGLMQNCVSTSSVDKLITNEPDSWETSFVMPHSKSTQPLLPEPEPASAAAAGATGAIGAAGAVGAAPGAAPGAASGEPADDGDAHNSTDRLIGPAEDAPRPAGGAPAANLSTGISLDACKLAKQGQSKPYVNVTTGNELAANGAVQRGPYCAQAPPSAVYINSAAKHVQNDAEISC